MICNDIIGFEVHMGLNLRLGIFLRLSQVILQSGRNFGFKKEGNCMIIWRLAGAITRNGTEKTLSDPWVT